MQVITRPGRLNRSTEFDSTARVIPVEPEKLKAFRKVIYARTLLIKFDTIKGIVCAERGQSVNGHKREWWVRFPCGKQIVYKSTQKKLEEWLIHLANRDLDGFVSRWEERENMLRVGEK